MQITADYYHLYFLKKKNNSKNVYFFSYIQLGTEKQIGKYKKKVSAKLVIGGWKNYLQHDLNQKERNPRKEEKEVKLF